MDPSQLTIVSKPPPEAFEAESARLQDNELVAVPGEYFDRMEYPEEGDMLVHYFDHPYPFKGQPYPQAVDAIQAPKKLMMGTARFARRHFILAGLFLVLPGFITDRYIISLSEFYLESYVGGMLRPHRLAPKRYCRSAREVARAGAVVIQRVSDKWRKLVQAVIDIIVAVFQWDNAWRFRGQDAAGELNKESFYKNPSKEIARLMKIEVQRERGWHEDKGRALLAGQALRFVMFFRPSVKKFLVDFIKELNLDEVKLDEADDYHNLCRPDYDVHGWPIELRQKKYLKAIQEYREAYPERLQKGVDRIEQVRMLTAIQHHIMKQDGFPLMVFFAVPEGEKTRVNVAETELLRKYPKLRDSCIELVQKPRPDLDPSNMVEK